MTTLILNPRGKDGGRRPARVAGRGEVKTRKLDRLPGERPGTDVRKTSAEAEATHLPERSLGTLFLFLFYSTGSFLRDTHGPNF